jgi:hypothetical protein
MRGVMSLAVLAVVLAAAAAQERPEEVVKAAVAAAGGAEVLAKYPAGRVTGRGTMTLAAAETPFTCEQAYHVPGRFRTLVRCEVKGQKWELLQVVNDTAVRQAINGKAVALTEAGTREVQLAVLLNEVAQLTPLVADRKFALKADRQAKMSESGLLVSAKGHPELRLGFDRKTGHLVRIAYRTTDPDAAKEVDTETVFGEFKEVSGITRPTRCVITRDGKKVLEMAVEKFTPLVTIDPQAFAADE